MNEKELKKRTKQFALRVIKLVNALPKISKDNQLVGSSFVPELLLALIIGRPV